ncbi:MAG: nucleotidyltransferase domain-containing protein [Gaiellaceae bacterium]
MSRTAEPVQFAGLPEHERLLAAILSFFRGVPGAVGAFLGGSNARGGMDRHSDLDVGIVFADAAARDAAWARRREWEIAPRLHAYDADHIRPYFAYFLYEPGIVAELPLYTLDEVQEARWGGPYLVVWDETGELEAQLQGPAVGAFAEDLVKQDEQFWAWTLHGVKQARRGEWYSVATGFFVMRELVEAWDARLHGEPHFDVRRLEQRRDPGRLAELFPSPARDDLKRAFGTLIEVHEEQRARLDAGWTTTEAMRDYVREEVERI